MSWRQKGNRDFYVKWPDLFDSKTLKIWISQSNWNKVCAIVENWGGGGGVIRIWHDLHVKNMCSRFTSWNVWSDSLRSFNYNFLGCQNNTTHLSHCFTRIQTIFPGGLFPGILLHVCESKKNYLFYLYML